MEEIIKILAARFNLPEDTVRTAAGALLNILKKKASGTQFEKLLAALPGSASVMFSAPSGSSSETGGGLLGGLLGRASGLLGGDLGDAAESFAALQKAGIPTEKIVPLAKALISEAQKQAGPEVVSALVEQVPALKMLLHKEDATPPETGPTTV